VLQLAGSWRTPIVLLYLKTFHRAIGWRYYFSSLFSIRPNGGTFNFRGGFSVGVGSVVSCSGGTVTIGNRVYIGRNCTIACHESIDIGQNAMIANGVSIYDHDHGIEQNGIAYRDQPFKSSPVFIGNGAWIGANAVILKGASIGAGSVVAAGAVVVKSIPEFELWGGVPAKFIKKLRHH